MNLSSSAFCASPQYDQANFASTHNSYAGGTVDSLSKQLNSGVRVVEFDIWSDNVATLGDYEIGHNSAGDGVQLGNGNPGTAHFSQWLSLIRAWSDQHKGHAPITVVVDVKGGVIGPIFDCSIGAGGLTDKQSYLSGNLAFLNAQLEKAFNDKLYRADSFAGHWPTVDEMRDRIVIVLSGDLCTRREYRWDVAHNPAAAINSKGQLVEVHDTGAGNLWYWTGQYQKNGSVKWYRHGRFDTGKRSAVAINDDGWVVEVHESLLTAKLFYQLGKMGEDYEITWFNKFAGIKFDDGLSIEPTVSFATANGLSINEVHKSASFFSAGDHFEWHGSIDTKAHTIAWTNNAPTGKAQYNRSTVIIGCDSIVFSTEADGASPPETLC